MREIKFRAWDGNDSTMHNVAGLNWRTLSGYGEPEHYATEQITDIDYAEFDKGGYQALMPWVSIDSYDDDVKRIDVAIKEHESYMTKVVLMQYTGLKDKNGVEIYEGDIVDTCVFLWDGSDKRYTGVVVWHEGEYQIWPNTETEYWGNDGSPSLYHTVTNDDEAEVIGNIYENPELLEGGDK